MSPVALAVSERSLGAESEPTPGLPEGFHPAVRAWFRERFPHGPTPPQGLAWPTIRAREDTLVAAPTGSGKTLSAFLVAIDQLYHAAERGALSPGIRVVYVSPLKALVADIYENLERPLREIREVALRLGLSAPELHVGMRNGDTSFGDRARLLKAPPHFLVTTPESLFLLVTAAKSRELLRTVDTLIVDEIHALARDKRGVHLALTLERLRALCVERPMRIGLSATQRPIAAIAHLLVGNELTVAGAPRCAIVNEGHLRGLDLAIELPDREVEAVASTEYLDAVLEKIARHIAAHRTTLVFVNTRRLAERLAHLLALRVPDLAVAAHHGSLAKERRLDVEGRLRRGELRALVATASLELGIDVGPVELVCQVGSPRSIATFLQRVGRSGHTRFGTPKGVLFPMTRDELVECTALLRAVHGGRLDSLRLPQAPADILAQQIVAECAAGPWEEDALFALIKRAAPFTDLPRAEFDAVVRLMSEGVETGRGRKAAFLHRDTVARTLHGRRGARLAALTSGGAIPETADYRVVEEPGDTLVGTINEDFAIESMAGDVFLLGSTSWRIRRVAQGLVRVVNAEGAAPSVPFWLGEAPARTIELSEEVSGLRQDVDAALSTGGKAAAFAAVVETAHVVPDVAAVLVDYLAVGRDALGVLPTLNNLVVERFFDESGGMQLVIHSPLGGRMNRGLGLLLRKRFCRSFDFELQAAATDDAVVLSLGAQHSFPLEDVRDFLSPKGVRDALIHALLPTPMFQTRWRWNLNRFLIVLRRRGGKVNPPPIQRMEADDVMAAVFPSLAACQDNATGPREIPDHPIVNQTLTDCLTEAMDLGGLEALLIRIASGDVQLHFRDTTEPSVLCHEILNARPYSFLDDAPLEERRTRAVQLRRGLQLDPGNLAALDPEAIARVRAEAALEPRGALELHDLLCDHVLLRPVPEWSAWFQELCRGARATEVVARGTHWWVAAERVDAVRQLWPEAQFGAELSCPEHAALDVVSTARALVRAVLQSSGPLDVASLVTRTQLEPSQVTQALAELEASGLVLCGRFEADVAAAQYCSRHLLSRIHSYTQARLRREIEPVTAQEYLRFLVDFHGLTAATRRFGQAGLTRTVAQLQGFEAAASAWESELLPARVRGFEPELLDAGCFSGEVTWGRYSGPGQVAAASWASISRVTPITLALRENVPWLLRSMRPPESEPFTTHLSSGRVVLALSRRGALFFSELARESDLSGDELSEALWDSVARGLVTSDGYAALRSLLRGRSRVAATTPQGRGLRRGHNDRRPREGRWSLMEPALVEANSEELAEAVAEQLLARYGIVFRDVLQRESFAVPWRDIAWALRRLEARGQVRGGRFVRGFVGEQFALPEAVEALRAVRRSPLTGELIRVSACDPLNLVGIIVPGERVAAQPGAHVFLRDGVAVAPTTIAEPLLANS